ncbi:MAG TPA: hypothetical protein VF600_10345 [Abditibacteriaceae bacterium]|jgi:hypothetical protein
MLLCKTRSIGLFIAGFLAGSCAIAFLFGLLFFAAGSGGITAPWLANATLVRGITNVAGLLCGSALAWHYSQQ